MAAMHRGLRYVRRTALADCRWPVRSTTQLRLAWSDEMAYVVGLTATDGCLYSKRRKVNFKSMDRPLVATYLELLGRTNAVKSAPTRSGATVYFTEFHDTRLYEWFLSIGLTPRKSLTLGGIDVPDAFLMPLVRGLLDGDGSVINAVYRADTARRSDYYWEYLITSFNSVSRAHIEWLRERLLTVAGVDGAVCASRPSDKRRNRSVMYQLRYAKRASTVLLPLLYPRADAPCLARKRAIWYDYASRHGLRA
jgi:hypothetical protein